MDRSPELDLLPFAESHGRVIIAHSPLAKGLLSGRYHEANRPTNRGRATDPLFNAENLGRAEHLITVMRDVADAHSATPAQIALAWVIHRPGVAAITGASSVEQLESNVAAAEIELDDDEYQALQTVSSQLFPTAVRHDSVLGALRHCARGGKYLARTVSQDHMR